MIIMLTVIYNNYHNIYNRYVCSEYHGKTIQYCDITFNTFNVPYYCYWFYNINKNVYNFCLRCLQLYPTMYKQHNISIAVKL